MARAPQAIYSLWADVQKAIPSAVLSGIVGDAAHSFGYHLSRQELPASDYSVQLTLDKRGASDCASALDISLSPSLMQTCTRRLLTAAKAGDPRLKGLREFCGTLNGADTYPWDLSTNTSEGVNSWDNSHLWHIHLSFFRAYADDYTTLAPIAQVLAGIQGDDMPTPADLWNYVITDAAGNKTTAGSWLTHTNDKADQAIAAAKAATAAATALAGQVKQLQAAVAALDPSAALGGTATVTIDLAAK